MESEAKVSNPSECRNQTDDILVHDAAANLVLHRDEIIAAIPDGMEAWYQDGQRHRFDPDGIAALYRGRGRRP
jgi:hypothetical protein